MANAIVRLMPRVTMCAVLSIISFVTACPLLAAVSDIASGNYHTVALKSDGTLMAWGSNADGQLGDGSFVDSNRPVSVSGAQDIVELASEMRGTHSMAIDENGRIWAWGANGWGQLGNGGYSTEGVNAPFPIGGITTAIEVSAGKYHSLAVMENGTVLAWGRDSEGQLGKGSIGYSLSPVEVSGLTGVVDVAAGSYFSVALTAVGNVWTWGQNDDGQLGDGTTTMKDTPQQVPNLSNVIAIAAGCYHTVALKDDGTVWSWGHNGAMQLQDGTQENRAVPVQIAGITDAVAIAAGGYHTMVLRADGTVWAWGYHSNGQVGDGIDPAVGNIHTLAQVINLTYMTSISAGYLSSAAVRIDGTLYTWGLNLDGQLGDGTSQDQWAPVQVFDSSGLAPLNLGAVGEPPPSIALLKLDGMNRPAVSAGGVHGLAVSPGGEVWAWGSNYYGQLGNGANEDSATPVSVAGISNAIGIAAGYQFSMALLEDGSVRTWGDNSSGQLGDGTQTPSNVPVEPAGLPRIAAVSAGNYFSAALAADGSVWTWGSNSSGQLGNGTLDNSATPAAVQDLYGVVAIAAGGFHCLVLKSDGTVYAWGNNDYGQVGSGNEVQDVMTPVRVPGLSGIVAVSAGKSFSMALKSDGTVWVWGSNTYGQLGNGSTARKIYPVQVRSLPVTVGIECGYYSARAVDSDGSVWGWGDNYYGGLGDGTRTTRLVPIRLSLLTDAVQISAGAGFSTVLKTDGSLWSVGYNSAGQIGDGTQTLRSSFVQVVGEDNLGFLDFSAPIQEGAYVAAGYRHTVVRQADGRVLAWGYSNEDGQLGAPPNDLERQFYPIWVAGIGDAISVAVGRAHSLALTKDGAVWGWGDNSRGQIGNGSTTDVYAPVMTSNLSSVTMIDADGYHSLALRSDGRVFAWGSNSSGQLGTAAGSYSSLPVQVGSLDSVVAVSAGWAHSLALKSDGTVWGWGDNGEGQLGRDTPSSSSTPLQIPGLSNAVSIAAGAEFSIALMDNGTVFAWGAGHGDAPQQVTGLGSIVAVAAGYDHWIALDGDGNVWARDSADGGWHIPDGLGTVTAVYAGYRYSAVLTEEGQLKGWGYNTYGLLGTGTQISGDYPVAALSPDGSHPLNLVYIDARRVTPAIAGGGDHTLLLSSDGTVWACGEADHGVLGDGTDTDAPIPVKVVGLSDKIAVAAGYNASFAIRHDGTLWAWGKNFGGVLGDGTTDDRDTPVRVQGIANVTAAAVGSYHALALKADGTVWAWGWNEDGQLGDGSTVQNRTLPGVVPGLYQVKQISAGYMFNLALKSDGTVWSWGYNNSGQLGDGTTESRRHPVQVSGLSDVVAVSAGMAHAMALKSDGSLWAWGLNDDGQLGIGTNTGSLLPAKVAGIEDVIDVGCGNYSTMAATADGSVWIWGDTVYIWHAADGTDEWTWFPNAPHLVNELSDIVDVEVGGGADFFALKSDGTVWSWSSDGIRLNTGRTTATTSEHSPGPMLGPNGEPPMALTSTSVSSGVYNVPLDVEIRCGADPAACQQIYYTIDGSNPTTAASLYSSPVAISSSTTLKIMRVDQEGKPGVVETLSYTIDTEVPTITVNDLVDAGVVKSLHAIVGTAQDNGAGIAAVRVQISDGTEYLVRLPGSGLLSFSAAAGWVESFPDPETGEWGLDTSLVNWVEGATYTLNAVAVDHAGNESAPIVLDFVYFSGERAYTTLSLTLSSNAILQNGSLSLSGKLTRLPQADADLSGKPIHIQVVAPDDSKMTHSVDTYSLEGHFELKDIIGFNQKGTYTVRATFSETVMLAGALAEASVFVGTQAGYAIIVEGKIASEEGLASHNKTTNRIYHRLLDRGFSDLTINYFNYNTAQAGIAVDNVPSKAGVQTAIEDWAAMMMNSAAAPLYIIMVDHGSKGMFHIGDETISPPELDAWMGELETKLSAGALAEKRVVIIGSCYSGSFVPAVSGTGRIVITSADFGEESYKGPLESDGVRSGEFFLEELFQQLWRGKNLTSAFVDATERTEVYTRKGGSSTNAINAYFDDAVQHPLLDDDGDGAGSNVILNGQGDGMVSSQLFLGVGRNYVANSVLNPAEVIQVTDTIFLSPSESAADFYAKANDNAQVASLWMEIRSPSVVLTAADGTDQLEIDLDKQLMTLQTATSLWGHTASNFETPGLYEIFYFAKDTTTGDISPMVRSVLYKNKAGNSPPASFDLVAPANGTEQKTVLVFSWETTSDPEADPLTYTIEIAQDISFSTIVYCEEGIVGGTTHVDVTAGLNDLSTYYWRVKAVDAYGAITQSSHAWRFDTNNTNHLPAFVSGLVFNKSTSEPIEGATITTSGGINAISISGGAFLFSHPAGIFSINVSHAGYDPATYHNLEIGQGATMRYSFALEPEIVDLCPNDPNKTTPGRTGCGNPEIAGGDVNTDGVVDLADAILTLRVLSGGILEIEDSAVFADLDGDGQLGLPEVLHTLRSLSGLP